MKITAKSTRRAPIWAWLSGFGLQLANHALILSLALAVGGLVILVSGKDPIAAYRALFVGALGNRIAIANTLDRSTVLILAGLAAVMAFSTSVNNLGIEGQLYLGAFAAAWVGFGIRGFPQVLHVALALLAGALAGALWSLLPIWLKIRWQVEEIVTTLMFNYIAMLFTAYLVAFPFASKSTFLPGTEEVLASARLPRLMRGSALNAGFVIALVMVAVVQWFLFRTKQGYELRMVGLNRRFAAYAGMPVRRSALLGMLLSGALAGIGGGAIILGFFGRFITAFSSGYGWDGIVICLLAKNNPVAVVPAALFYAALANGSLEMQAVTKVSSTLVGAVKGVIMFLVTARVFFNYLSKRWPQWAQ